MRYLKPQDANKYLVHIGMHIGSWNQITDIDTKKNSEENWINYAAPSNATELFNFSQHVAGWLPKGEWKILQIDNSNNLDFVQIKFIENLLSSSDRTINLDTEKTFFFEFGKSINDNNNIDLLISNLIYAFLLFEGHAYFVSSSSCAGERLAIQDGYAYFSSKDKDACGAKNLLRNFSKKPLASPQWIVNIISDEQA
ncbi:MAG: hypothetical protein V4754_19490 [Pseudomonadota bacterium]